MDKKHEANTWIETILKKSSIKLLKKNHCKPRVSHVKTT